MTDIELLSNLKAEGGLYIVHNPQKGNYQEVESYEEDMDLFGNEYSDNWISLAEYEKAVAMNEMWEMQVYPDTPIGSYTLLASSLEAILDYLRAGMLPEVYKNESE